MKGLLLTIVVSVAVLANGKQPESYPGNLSADGKEMQPKLKFQRGEVHQDISLQPGSMLRIQGYIPKNADTFTVNLQTGPDKRPASDVALQLSIRLLKYTVVRNTLQSGNWGREETTGVLTLARGQMFELTILCDPRQYTISLNGQFFAQYTHRMAYSKVRHLHIDQDVSISLVRCEEQNSQEQVTHQWRDLVFKHTPVLDYAREGFAPGKTLSVKGLAPPNIRRFDINLKAGPNRGDDVVLQLSVRYSEKVIIRNTYENGKWGNEERAGDFPISDGEMIQVDVLSDNNRFMLFINGEYYAEYRQRLPYYRVSYVEVTEDMAVTASEYNKDVY